MARDNSIELLLPTSVLILAQGVAWVFDSVSRRAPVLPAKPEETDSALCDCPPRRRRDVEPARPTLLMTQAVFQRVLAELLRLAPEAGGALIGPRDTELVTHYLPNDGEATPDSFTLDHHTLNRQLAALRDAGLDLKGIVHSHPAGVHSPSSGDLAYIERLLANPRNRSATTLAFPIVCDGRLWPYAAVRGATGEVVLRRANLTLI